MAKMQNEIWKPVNNYEHIYAVSNLGRIKNIKRNIIKKPHLNRDGYLYVSLCNNGIQKTKKIHRIVCEAFNDLKDKHKNHVDHIDGNKHNNASINLRWCTHAENIYFAIQKGLYNNVGQMHGMSLLNDSNVSEIKLRLMNGEKAKTIHIDYGVSINAIYDIKQGRTWKHIK